MPSIEKATPVPGMYPEDLMGENGENKNPWAMLEELVYDKPAYTVDDSGNYKYKQADAMNRFSSLVKEARQAGDDQKAEYYESFMRHTLENNPIGISDEDFSRLSDDGKLKFYRLSGMQATLNGDATSANQWRQRYDEPKRLKNGEQPQKKEEEIKTKPLEQRVHFDLSDDKARKLLVDAMEITPHTGYLPNESSIYYTFSHELPDDMERKEPTDYDDFGLDFFRKQKPDCTGSAKSLRELFKSDEYKSVASPCIHPQSEGGDKTLDEAMGFIHCKNPNKKGPYGGEDGVACRFYMCPKPDNLVPIMEAFTKESEAADLPYYFKFSTNPNRNDKLVIYSSGDMAEKHLATLEKINKEHPEWFEDTGKNPLWGVIEGVKGVYYGAEPLETGKDSYGGRRAKIFSDALSEWRQEFGVTVHASNYKELIRSENISDEQVKRFKELFAEACRKEGIAPKNFASAR